MKKRNLSKARAHSAKWYALNAARLSAERKAKFYATTEGILYLHRRAVSAEITALRHLGANARRWSRAQRRPLRRFASKMLSHIRRRSPTKVDYDLEWLTKRIKEKLDAGVVSLDRRSPNYASIDQRIGGLGYHRDNIQIVPLWYNLAKWQWSDAEISDAVTKWVFARAVGE